QLPTNGTPNLLRYAFRRRPKVFIGKLRIAVYCSGLLIMYVPDCAPTGAVTTMLSPAGTPARVVWHAPGPVMNRVFTRLTPDSRFTLTPPAPAPSVATQTVTISRTF